MDLRDPLQVFLDEAAEKHKKGVMEHRGGDYDRPFNGDLRQEFQDEMLDAYNYLMEMERRGWVNGPVVLEARKNLLNLWFMARVTLEGL